MKSLNANNLLKESVIIKKELFTVLMAIFLTTGLLTTFALSEDIPMMTKDELKTMLENPDLVIVDVRLIGDYMSGDLKIKGAVRAMGGTIGVFMQTYPKGRTFVFYCASPNEETSAMLAKGARLSYGFTKVYVLKGGWEEWLKANYPTEKK